jgi:hypothetical protein
MSTTLIHECDGKDCTTTEAGENWGTPTGWMTVIMTRQGKRTAFGEPNKERKVQMTLCPLCTMKLVIQFVPTKQAAGFFGEDD